MTQGTIFNLYKIRYVYIYTFICGIMANVVRLSCLNFWNNSFNLSISNFNRLLRMVAMGKTKFEMFSHLNDVVCTMYNIHYYLYIFEIGAIFKLFYFYASGILGIYLDCNKSDCLFLFGFSWFIDFPIYFYFAEWPCIHS